MTAPIPGGEYLTTKEAVIALGISKATLYRRRMKASSSSASITSPLAHLRPPTSCGTSRKYVRSKAHGKRRKQSDDEES